MRDRPRHPPVCRGRRVRVPHRENYLEPAGIDPDQWCRLAARSGPNPRCTSVHCRNVQKAGSLRAAGNHRAAGVPTRIRFPDLTTPDGGGVPHREASPVSEIKVTVEDVGESAPQATERAVATGTKAWELFADDPAVIAARVGGVLKDLAYELADGDAVEGVTVESSDGRNILRHSPAHVMAQAVQELFPEAKLGIGPPITDGFYYDFDVPEPFKPEDLAKSETRMRKIVKEGQRSPRRLVADDDARPELADEPYKLELIGLKGASSDGTEAAEVEVGGGELTIYDNLRRNGELAWKDLCRGPHLPTTKRIPAFKLMRTAAAYWRGSEQNKQLQRIYGTAWESKDALAEHLHRLEEAEKRDHRKLGAELDLFSFPEEIGSGLPVFHPKGALIRRIMEEYSRQRHEAAGYQFVNSPHITKENLFRTSGHLEWFADGMFP